MPRIGAPEASSACASFSGVWPPNWTMTPTSVPFSCSFDEDRQHVLGGQRLEIEPVGGVVVGRDGLRVAVDHDRLEAGLAQREAGVAAAIVELDALADAVGAAAEDDDLALVRRLGLAFRRVAERRSRRSSTCRRSARRTRRRRCRCACRPAARPALARAARTSASSRSGERGQPRVGKARRLQRAEMAGVGGQAVARAPCSSSATMSAIWSQEPGVDLGRLVRPRRRSGRAATPGRSSAAGRASACRSRRAATLASSPLPKPLDLDLVEAGEAGLQPAQRLLQASAKVRPIAITSPTDFIEVVRIGSAPGNFSKAKRGILVTT